MPDYLIRTTVKTPAIEVHGKPPVMHDATTERLIRAKNEVRAVAHVVKDTLTCDKATTDEIIWLTAAGVKLETAE